MLSKMMAGALDPTGALEHLRNGGNIIIVNNNGKGSEMEEPEDEMEMPEQEMEAPEGMAPGMMPEEEPADMRDAIKRAMSPVPKAPSPGVGKGPKNPQTPPKSAKLAAKKAPPPKLAPKGAKAPMPKKG